MKNWWEDEQRVAAALPADGLGWHLCLYVAGPGARAEQAEANVRQCCEHHLAGQYQLEIIDLTQQPELARERQILALPLLVRHQPDPHQYLVGTLSDETQLLGSLLAHTGR